MTTSSQVIKLLPRFLERALVLGAFNKEAWIGNPVFGNCPFDFNSGVYPSTILAVTLSLTDPLDYRIRLDRYSSYILGRDDGVLYLATACGGEFTSFEQVYETLRSNLQGY